MATGKTAKNLERLRRLIAEAADVTPASHRAWKERARIALVAVYGEGSPQLERFDDIRYTLGFWSDTTPQSRFDAAVMGGVRNATEMLTAVAEDIEHELEVPEVEMIDVAGLHPWVSDAAARLWTNGHRQQAVQAAATAVEQWLRAKLDVHKGPAASLVASAFSPTAPATGSPRLRFQAFDPAGSDSWKNAHEGASAFGRGVMLRIRNLYTHATGGSEQEDLEALAALSLLARWIDEATVEHAGAP